jgi:hypothetical protein
MVFFGLLRVVVSAMTSRKQHAYSGHFGDADVARRHREPVRFTCFLCEGGTDRLTGQTWKVPAGPPTGAEGGG